MITYHPSSSRYVSFQNGVTTHGLFSYDNFFDSDNIHFGPVVAFNDYTVEPGCGFGWHPHQDLEQLFFIYEGVMEHTDSINSGYTLTAPSMQRITTGSGYARSTRNTGCSVLRYIGIWLEPRFAALAPGTEVRRLEDAALINTVQPVVSGSPELFPGSHGESPLMALNCDAAVFLCRLEKGKKVAGPQMNGRHSGLLYIVQGAVRAGEQYMEAGAHLRMTGTGCPELAAEKDALLLIMELS